MPEHLIQACQIRESKIEALYKRLTQVKTSREQQKVLTEIELVTGVKLLH